MAASPEFKFVFAKSGAVRKQHQTAVKSYRRQSGSSPFHHTRLKAFSRAKGHSAVAAAAYRSGEVLVDQRTGEIHDYSRKNGTDESFIIAPKDAPAWATDRSALWNEAERIETRKNAQVGREVLVALPLELSHAERVELVAEYVDTVFTKKGIVADVAMHDVESHNPHAHILFTNRPIERGGFVEKVKQPTDRKQYFEERKAELAEIRHTWSELANLKLAGIGSTLRIDHRSYKDREINQAPTTHLGKAAHGLEKRNEPSVNGEVNRATQTLNAVNAEIIDLENAREALARKRSEQRKSANIHSASDSPTKKEYGPREQFTYKLATALLKKENPNAWAEGTLDERKALIVSLGEKLDVNERAGKLNFGALSNKAGIDAPVEPSRAAVREIRRIASATHIRSDYSDNQSYRAAIRETGHRIAEQTKFGQITDLAEHAETLGVPPKEKGNGFEMGD